MLFICLISSLRRWSQSQTLYVGGAACSRFKIFSFSYVIFCCSLSLYAYLKLLRCDTEPARSLPTGGRCFFGWGKIEPGPVRMSVILSRRIRFAFSISVHRSVCELAMLLLTFNHLLLLQLHYRMLHCTRQIIVYLATAFFDISQPRS